MNNNPKVSVIVAVYKAENYLRRCVDSLLAQTFIDFEVLLVDDGSPDSSGEICDEYAAKDSRVRVFHKKNEGVSATRQFGIDHALGEYTIHADPDDWVEPTMLEELYAKAKKENADMVICDFWQKFDNEEEVLMIQRPKSIEHRSVLKEMFQRLHGSCWNKLIKRVCYSDFQVSFPSDLSLSEDLYVMTSLLKNNIKISYLPEAFYHYELGLNVNSITKVENSCYEDDLYMRNSFHALFAEDDEIQRLCDFCFDFRIFVRAYFRREFTSIQFVKKCGGYRNMVFRKNKELTLLLRIRLFLSTIGLYRLMVWVDCIKDKLFLLGRKQF